MLSSMLMNHYLYIVISRCICLVSMIGLFVVSGCNNIQPASPTVTIPTVSTVLASPRIPTTVHTTTNANQAYPSAVIESQVMPTQPAVPYPSPINQTAPVIASLPASTPQPAETSSNNPYPLLETQIMVEAGASSPAPYPAPVLTESPSMLISVTPNPNPVATSTAPAPLATLVRTRFVATDPTSVDLAAGRTQLVVFFAEWCILCRSVAPVILNLEGQYPGRMNFIYLDVDDPETKTLQEKMNYKLIARPHIYLIDPQGSVLREWTGYISLEELQEAIRSVLG